MSAYPHPPRKYVDFGKLMTDTWRLVWRHKFLWFFGLFAGGSTSMGGWNGNFDFGDGSQTDNGTGQTERYSREIGDWITTHLTLILLLAGAVIILFLLLWLWSIICRGAVIGSVRDARQDKPISFGGAFARGRESFWRLLLFDLFLLLLAFCLMLIIAAVILLIIFLAAVAGSAGKIILVLLGLWLFTFIAFGLGYLLCCSIFFLPWVLIGVIVTFATRSVILEGERPMAALRRGGRVMMANLTQTLFLFLISVGLGIGAAIVMVIAGGASAVPAIIAWVVAYNQGWPISTIVIASILLIMPLVVFTVAAALMNTYFTAYWTIGFDKLAGNEPTDEHKPPQIQPRPAS
jgi:hypothetical protein